MDASVTVWLQRTCAHDVAGPAHPGPAALWPACKLTPGCSSVCASRLAPRLVSLRLKFQPNTPPPWRYRVPVTAGRGGGGAQLVTAGRPVGAPSRGSACSLSMAVQLLVHVRSGRIQGGDAAMRRGAIPSRPDAPPRRRPPHLCRTPWPPALPPCRGCTLGGGSGLQEGTGEASRLRHGCESARTKHEPRSQSQPHRAAGQGHSSK